MKSVTTNIKIVTKQKVRFCLVCTLQGSLVEKVGQHLINLIAYLYLQFENVVFLASKTAFAKSAYKNMQVNGTEKLRPTLAQTLYKVAQH